MLVLLASRLGKDTRGRAACGGVYWESGLPSKAPVSYAEHLDEILPPSVRPQIHLGIKQKNSQDQQNLV